MVTRTFISKSNTIIKGSNENMGLNPILMLTYGNIVSRGLIYFDIDKIKKNIEDKTFASLENVKHTLCMTNCGSIDNRRFEDTLPSIAGSGDRERATSFDLIFFELPSEWDQGRGFDSSLDYWLIGKGVINTNGSNWEYAYNGKKWDTDGIYSSDFLSKEIEKFNKKENSIIVAHQHFDYGNENIKADLTDYINNLVKGNKKNNGLGIAFSPMAEETTPKLSQYVGFFTHHTNTFFQPFIESRYNEQINDNRYDFSIGKKNNLLFLASFNGSFVNLDELPTCSINDVNYPVKQVSKGIYSAEVNINKKSCEPETILYDIWDNLKFDEEEIEPVEMEFVTHKSSLSLGTIKAQTDTVSPLIIGINDCEKINQGEIRELKVYFKKAYTQNDYKLLDNCEYRLYVMDDKREIDVIDWDLISKISDFNVFYIKTDELLPNKYKVDIRAKMGNEIRLFKDCLNFEIINNSTIEKL